MSVHDWNGHVPDDDTTVTVKASDLIDLGKQLGRAEMVVEYMSLLAEVAQTVSGQGGDLAAAVKLGQHTACERCECSCGAR